MFTVKSFTSLINQFFVFQYLHTEKNKIFIL